MPASSVSSFVKAASVVLLSLSTLAATGCCCCGSPMTEEERAQWDAEQAQRTAERAEQSAKEEAERQAAEQAKWAALPDSERAFCEALTTHRDIYRAADNDLKKSKARRDRAKALLAAVPSGRVQGWTGTVSTLTTTGDGNVVLVLSLPCSDFSVGTTNNEFSDLLDKTLISATSPVYDTLAEMSVGDSLTFGGQLLRDDVNGWKGTSITELGSMTGEAFLIRF